MRSLRTFLAITASLFLSSSLQAAELRLEGSDLARLIQNAFAGTSIKLHHDLPTQSGNPLPGSFLQLGPNLRNQRLTFSIPDDEESLGFAGSAIFQINDINSDPRFVISTPQGRAPMGQNIGVVATPAAFLINIRFEDEGTEILGKSLGRVSRLRGSLVPNVEVNRMSLQIALFPQTVNNSTISFKACRVTFFGDIQAQGLANLSVAGRHVDIVNALTDYKATLKESIERQVARLIDQNLPQLAAQLQREVMRRGQGLGMRITSVQFNGTTLIIRGEPS